MARVLFVVRAMLGGGAERQLAVLATGLANEGHGVAVATFYTGGPYERTLLAGSNVELIALDKRGELDTASFFTRAVREFRRYRPDVIHGYMEPGNLVATAVHPFLPGCRLVWGLRNARLPEVYYDRLNRVAHAVSLRLARRADLVISNSDALAREYGRRGYPLARTVVVPNGIDTSRFAPDRARGEQFRAAHGIPSDALLVGMIARLDPMKGWETFIDAARLLVARRPEVRFIAVGGGDSREHAHVERAFDESGLGDRLHRVGFVDDVTAVHNALDVATSTSWGEGFSNALAEAMACGVPCVASDVGDAARILGDTGRLVPPRDAEATARGWDEMLNEVGPHLARRCRARITTEFTVAQLVTRTTAVLGLANPAPSSGAETTVEPVRVSTAGTYGS